MRITVVVAAIVACCLLCGSALAVDDMVGVDWSGNVYTLDSTTGVGNFVGSSGFSGLNNMAVDSSGKPWVSVSGGALITIDPKTGAGTVQGTLSSSFTDIRGLAFGPGDVLYAVVNGSPDVLWSIDITTMTGTLIGSTGCMGIQGVACDTAGTVYAYDMGTGSGSGQGLVTLSLTTGAATDVNPSVGSNTGNTIQFLDFDAGGKLYAGRDSLYTIDLSTCVETLVGSGGYSDLRGADFLTTSWVNYGTGYPGQNGIPTLTLAGNPIIGGQPNLMVGSSAVATQTSILFLGLTKAQVMGFWGGELWLVPIASVVLPIAPAGYTLPLPIPNTPSLIGFKPLFQSLQADPGAAFGASSTPGLEITIGQ